MGKRKAYLKLVTVTDLERDVIKNIINSEYMDTVGERMIDWSVWSFTATNGTKQLSGALGSLVKKGFCTCAISEGDETCALTEEGYVWAKNNLNMDIEKVFTECFDNEYSFRKSINIMSDEEVKECITYYAESKFKSLEVCPKCDCNKITGDGSKIWCLNSNCDFIEAI